MFASGPILQMDVLSISPPSSTAGSSPCFLALPPPLLPPHSLSPTASSSSYPSPPSGSDMADCISPARLNSLRDSAVSSLASLFTPSFSKELSSLPQAGECGQCDAQVLAVQYAQLAVGMVLDPIDIKTRFAHAGVRASYLHPSTSRSAAGSEGRLQQEIPLQHPQSQLDSGTSTATPTTTTASSSYSSASPGLSFPTFTIPLSETVHSDRAHGAYRRAMRFHPDGVHEVAEVNEMIAYARSIYYYHQRQGQQQRQQDRREWHHREQQLKQGSSGRADGMSDNESSSGLDINATTSTNCSSPSGDSSLTPVPSELATVEAVQDNCVLLLLVLDDILDILDGNPTEADRSLKRGGVDEDSETGNSGTGQETKREEQKKEKDKSMEERERSRIRLSLLGMLQDQLPNRAPADGDRGDSGTESGLRDLAEEERRVLQRDGIAALHALLSVIVE